MHDNDGDAPLGWTYSAAYTFSFYANQIKAGYGITLEGSWGIREQRNVLDALDRMITALGGIGKFTSGSTFSFTYNSRYYGGWTRGSNIAFHGGKNGIPYQNYYHEIAHLIDNQSGDHFTRALASQRIYTPVGIYVMGGAAATYKRNSGGYTAQSVMDPVGRTADAQQHPGNAPCSTGNVWCISGNTPGEEWADLIANYVAGNFNTTPYGIARQSWVATTWASYFMTPEVRYLYGISSTP